MKGKKEETTVVDTTCKDEDLAHAVVDSLNKNIWVPDHVQAVVKNGWVTLSGSVTWGYESTSAANAIGHLNSVTGITNNITLNPNSGTPSVRDAFEQAFKRERVDKLG